MKRRTIGILALVVLFALGGYAWGAYSLGSKTTSKGGRHVTEIAYSTTDLTTKQDVFAAERISGYSSWVLYVKNTGSYALTDLDILIHYENANWDDAAINLVDAQPFGTDWIASCTTTLAADTVCAVGIDAAPPVGYLKVQASAGTANTVTVTFIGRID